MNSFEEFLKWLTGSSGGAFIIVAWLASWGFEKFSFWAKASKEVKALSILSIAGLLGAVSAFLLGKPEIVELIDPYFRPVMYVVLAWLTTQTAHGTNPLRKKTE